jgi:hypothetical protein
MMCIFEGCYAHFGGTCFIHIEDRHDFVVDAGRAAVRNRKQESL